VQEYAPDIISGQYQGRKGQTLLSLPDPIWQEMPGNFIVAGKSPDLKNLFDF
jgi:hypothetical protein